MQIKVSIEKAIIKQINDAPIMKAGDVQNYNPEHEGPKKLRIARARRPQKQTRAHRPPKIKAIYRHADPNKLQKVNHSPES